MDISLGLLYGILAMFCWGIGDFIIALIVRKVDVLRVLLWNLLSGLTFFLILFSFFFDFSLPSLMVAGLSVIAGASTTVAALSFFKGLQIGKVSVVSPIGGAFGIIVAVLSIIFLGERLTLLTGLGVMLTVMGTVLVSFRKSDIIGMRFSHLVSGARYGLIAMVLWGVTFFIVSILSSEIAWFLPVFYLRVFAGIILLSYMSAKRSPIAISLKPLSLLALVGILDSIAFLAYGNGVTKSYSSVVAPIAAAFPAVTIIMARTFLKEKIEINQTIGIISILASLVIISI